MNIEKRERNREREGRREGKKEKNLVMSAMGKRKRTNVVGSMWLWFSSFK